MVSAHPNCRATVFFFLLLFFFFFFPFYLTESENRRTENGQSDPQTFLFTIKCSLLMCGRASRRYSRVRILFQPLFFRLFLSNCLNWRINCNDHSSLSSAFRSTNTNYLIYTSHHGLWDFSHAWNGCSINHC